MHNTFPRCLSTRCLVSPRCLAFAMVMLSPLALLAEAPQKFKLWPDGAPGAKGEESTDQPTITVYLPDAAKQNGAAVVVCPGGGYGGLATNHEGDQIARFFNSFGVSAFVLHYRLGSKGYHHPIQLGDAQRAMRWVRHRAKQYKVDTDRIGIMGFSAGGHLASTAGTKFDAGKKDAEDPIDRVGCRPDFLVLCYPVISFTTPYTHQGSRRNLLGAKGLEDKKLVRSLSNELQVTKETPPTFLFHTSEDRAVPPENSVLFYLALRKAKVPCELHIYQKGRHGVGLIPGDPILSTWSDRLKDWLKTNNFLARPVKAPVKGSVTLNGQPARWGMLTFVPQDQAVPSVTLPVSNGRFDSQKLNTKGLPVGQFHVRFMLSRPNKQGLPHFNVVQLPGKQSSLVVQVARQDNTFEFDLKTQ